MIKFNRSPSEIAFRARQFLWNLKDRFHFYKRNNGCESLNDISHGRFFFDPEDIKSIVLQYKYNKWKDDTIIRADKICEHRFDLLGYKDLSFDNNEGDINWHFDPVNKKCSPLVWWQDVKYMNTNIVGDPKVIWELNRHQHLVLLGKAYVLSGNKRYHQEFFTQITSWFDANPPKKGISWTSSIELAYRSIAWIWVYHLFGKSNLPDNLLSIFYDLLFLHAEHIEHNLSIYFSPNTHLTGEALGLFYIGLFFSRVKIAERWIERGKDILIQEINRHILSDGGYMERSLWYHRYTIDIYIHFYLLSKLNNISLPSQIEQKILQMGEFLIYASSPDRRLPLIGDDDGGRLLPIDNLEGNDLRGLFSTLSVIFNRGDFKYLSGVYQEETLWLLGRDSKKIYDRIDIYEPPLLSKGFKDSGYFFIRSNWSEKANYLSFDCGPHGWLNCGHAHADLLSIQITSGKQPIIVDPGTYRYSGKYRDYFRGAESHCTIKVDGFYPAVTDSPFQWRVIPQHEFIKCYTDSRYDYIAGAMKGNLDWRHIREIFFIRPDIFFIVDTIEGTGRHELEIRFSLYGKEWKIRDRQCLLIDTDCHCMIEYVGKTDIEPKLIDSWVSLCYGHKIPSYTLVFKGDCELPCRVSFLINLSSHRKGAKNVKEYLK
ncbi:MAG: alginate lyase family protein [Nitrospirota bacterium]